MFEYIIGIIKYIYPTYIILETQQVGYRILTANPFGFQEQLTQEVTIYVEQVVREDSVTLYGFKTLQEKELFLTLNKVSGIGPKSALSILAAQDHDGLIQAIESGDSQYLTKFPGVGKKTAQQMILDLKGSLATLNEQQTVDLTDTTTPTSTQRTLIIDETSQALIGLGYSTREIAKIEKILQQESFDTTQQALSIAFKLLLK